MSLQSLNREEGQRLRAEAAKFKEMYERKVKELSTCQHYIIELEKELKRVSAITPLSQSQRLAQLEEEMF